MDVTPIYILSQILVAIYYLLLIITYQMKDYKKILLANTLAFIVIGISYFCLKAYTGLAMVVLGIIRNCLFYIDKARGTKGDKITKWSIIELCILFLLSIIFSIWTYEGPLSLMSVVATMTYTVSIWQKNTKIYKIFGIPTSIAGIIYNAYIKSFLGIIFESCTLISALFGLMKERILIRKQNM